MFASAVPLSDKQFDYMLTSYEYYAQRIQQRNAG